METQVPLDEAALPDYLRGIGLVDAGEAVSVEKAGDGNINWVRRARVRADGGPKTTRSFIVKQARPALERFPEYRVSTDRIVFEHRFYEAVRSLDTGGVCPRVIAFQEADRVLVLEDLGDVPRLDHVLAGGADVTPALAALARFLGRVHAATRAPEWVARFDNDAMRALHGDHIFYLPLRPNDFPTEPEVATRAARLQADPSFVALADAAYARYREPRGALVHGDVQAGNVLLARGGPKLLDAEIAHVGDPAFDLGTLLAHVALPAAARGDVGAAAPALAATWGAYVSSHGATGLAPYAEVARYAGLELLRRTIGAARVAAVARPDAALAVLRCAEAWIRRPPEAP